MTLINRPMFGSPRPRMLPARSHAAEAIPVPPAPGAVYDEPSVEREYDAAADAEADMAEEHVPEAAEASGDGVEADTASAHSRTKPAYSGESMVADYGTKPRDGMTAIFQLGDADQSVPHPFKGMKVGKSTGQRFHIVVSKPRVGAEDEVLFLGEGMLSWWSEDPANGMRTKIRFDNGPDGSEHHPLKGLEPGAKDGDVVFLACWAVADDEQIVDPRVAKKAVPRPFNASNAVRQSATMCERDPAFREFCRTEVVLLLSADSLPDLLPDFKEEPRAFAAEVVRLYCRVASRAEFGQDTPHGYEARNRWSDLLRRYQEWQRGWRVTSVGR